ncbi:GNAT family N-acetyltransferase [Undibacterium arcticum]|uniref:GNAT family N-acetyltransferase n=1 Tax=Undibacterium arcticum TaxID=1762892 RepID=A0ABV7F7T5_9BURK
MQITEPPKSGYAGISLRQLRRSDADDWYQYLSNPLAIEHTSWSINGVDELSLMFDAFESDAATSQIRLAIVDDNSGSMIGTIGFHSISDVHRTAELAYDMAPAYWGRGIGPAVCKAVVEWAFQNLGFVRIQATALESNHQSIRVLEKRGFAFEGVLRCFRMVRGRPGHFRIYSLLNPVWETSCAAV